MKERSIIVCPSTLAEGHSTYCKTALQSLFDGQRVSHLLDFTWEEDDDNAALAENTRNLSISGAQEKLSAIVYDGAIHLTREGEQKRLMVAISNMKARMRILLFAFANTFLHGQLPWNSSFVWLCSITSMGMEMHT